MTSFWKQALFCISLASLPSLFSAAYTWTGSQSSDWNETHNWNAGIVPTASDNATIPTGTRECVGDISSECYG